MVKWTDVLNQSGMAFIDFETSGLKPDIDHIIETGLLEVTNDTPSTKWRDNPDSGMQEISNGSFASSISWIINPNFPDPFHITTEVSALTGITDTEIGYGADGRVFFPSLFERIRWTPVWGHNLLRFDYAFIEEECRRLCLIPPPKKTWFDTAAIFKAWRLTLPDQKWRQEPDVLNELENYDTFYEWGLYILSKPIKGLYYNLPFCCETLGVDTTRIRFHRAGGDVLATYRVRNALKKLILG